MERDYDLIVWGASGFTGKLVVDYLQATYGTGNLRWAVAGRNRAKLEGVLAGRALDVLVADANDPESLENLVKRTRVVLTTVGPYARYGSPLVAQCARHGTHYCDLTGEVHWMRSMIEAHQDTARDSGARIVHACGFDSIPSDIGCWFLQREMQARTGVAARAVKYRLRQSRGGVSGGTVDSMMAMMEAAKDDPTLQKIVANPYALNFTSGGDDGPDITAPVYDPDFAAWVGPFVMAAINTRVVRRTHELLGHPWGHEFRYDEGTLLGPGAGGFGRAWAMALGTGAVTGLAATDVGRTVLKRVLPSPGEGPREETIRKGFFDVELLGKHPTDAQLDLRVRILGEGDPGYGSTSKMLSECAVSLAQDTLKGDGGFWTPASLMGEQLVERLPAHAGVTFEVIR